jgi:hypothetical protein
VSVRLSSAAVVALAGVTATGLALAGCAGQEQSGTPAHRVDVWVRAGGGGTSIGTVEVDNRNVGHVIATHNASTAVKEACALLTNDAETAIGNLPTPDGQITTDLNRAYEKGAAAGDDCYQGAAGESSLLRRSATERAALLPLLTVALARIRAVTGHSPSTSTTQPSGACSDPLGGCT